VIAPLLSSAVFLLACAALWFGRSLAQRLPLEHLTSEARNSAQIGIGMIATLAALVMGLMVSSSKASFDERQAEIVRVATTIVLLDHALAAYGTDTRDARDEVRALVGLTLARIAPSGTFGAEEFKAPLSNLGRVTHLQSTIMALAPANDAQRWFQSRAMTLTSDLARERTQTVERGERTIPNLVLAVVVSWVTYGADGTCLLRAGLRVFVLSGARARHPLLGARRDLWRSDARRRRRSWPLTRRASGAAVEYFPVERTTSRSRGGSHSDA
jgi:hypothetical protein